LANLEIDSKNLKLFVQLPSTDGIVDFINAFSKLYIGKIQPGIFKKAFKEIKSELLNTILTHKSNDENLGHKIDLCHQALDYNWYLPCTATIINDELWWESGQSRILAGGLCWTNAWDKHQVLLLAPDTTKASRYIIDPVEITSDCQLEKVLEISPDEKSLINVSLTSDPAQPIYLRLGAIKKSVTGHSYQKNLEQHIETLKCWMKQYPFGSKINVYTDCPEKVIDSSGYWSISHAGPALKFNKKSNIDVYLYKTMIQTKEPLSETHDFYIQDSSDQVDLSELLFWVDLKFNTLYTKDFQYCLHRKSIPHTTKFIGLSNLD
jgi:hypothetical protein